MTWYSETTQDENGNHLTHVWEDENKARKRIAYSLNKSKETIKFYPRDFVVSEVLMEGFTKIPPEFSDLGYIISAQGLLNTRLGMYKVNKFTIVKTGKDSIRFLPKSKAVNVVMSYASLAKLKNGITTINSDAKTDKSNFVDDFFSSIYPSHYKKGAEGASRARIKRAVQSLDSSVIKELSGKDIDKLLDFFSDLITRRYTTTASRNKLFTAAKIKVDQVAINDVIKQFEKLLKAEHPESAWSEFLQTNLFLLNSEYVAVIPELNLMLAGERKVDFGLISSYGYLDVFEIKKPTTPLMAKNKDRGNYYWSTDAVKAITQAEKYLYNAEKKAANLAEDIKRERGVDALITRPKAVLIIGQSSQLDSAAKKEDFQILRKSLKNIEIVLYDEMLTRLRNQMGKIYQKPNIELKNSKAKK